MMHTHTARGQRCANEDKMHTLYVYVYACKSGYGNGTSSRMRVGVSWHGSMKPKGMSCEVSLSRNSGPSRRVASASKVGMSCGLRLGAAAF